MPIFIAKAPLGMVTTGDNPFGEPELVSPTLVDCSDYPGQPFDIVVANGRLVALARRSLMALLLPLRLRCSGSIAGPQRGVIVTAPDRSAAFNRVCDIR